jgi:hypothetical protein
VSCGAILRALLLRTAFACLALVPAQAFGANVQITGLGDVNFGTISNLSVDAVSAQSVCVFSDTATAGYQITATGSGSSGAFNLSASGGKRLIYQVEWNALAGQSSGTQLTAKATLTGLKSSATSATCSSGPATSASLIVIEPASALSSAIVGSYSGTLTLLIGPE